VFNPDFTLGQRGSRKRVVVDTHVRFGNLHLAAHQRRTSKKHASGKASEKAPDTLLHLGTSLRQGASTDLWSLVF
jgi:hypothetical protein